MQSRKPQNEGRKIARVVEGKSEAPPQPNPAPQRQSAFQRTRAAAQERLKGEVIFPEAELTAEAAAEIRAKAEAGVNAYARRIKERLAASKGKAKIFKFDYLELLRRFIQIEHPEKPVPKRSAKRLVKFLPHFDWRLAGIVPEVRNQKNCGACWAFAATAAFESSLMRSRNFYKIIDLSEASPRVPFVQIGISVQHVLDCVSHGDCTGGWHGRALDYFVTQGVPALTIDVEGYPIDDRDYIGKKRPCKEQVKDKVRAIAWDYVHADPKKIPSVKKMKEALLEYGPLVVMVNIDEAFQKYPNGGKVVDEVFIGDNHYTPNHIVLLIGWNDHKRAWIIQNSVGAKWGVSCIEKRMRDKAFIQPEYFEKLGQASGCMYMRWNTNNIGQFATWIKAPFDFSAFD